MLPVDRPRIALAAISGSIFCVLAIAVALGLTTAFDSSAAAAVQSGASPALDLIASAQTVLGQAVVDVAVALLLSLVLWRRVGGLAWSAPALIAGTAVVELVLKSVFAHPGPPAELSRQLYTAPLSIQLTTPGSFPSGHVARLTFLAFLTAALVPGRASMALATAFVVASAYLRVYIGAHWLSDVLGGAALGGTWGALATMILKARPTADPSAPERAGTREYSGGAAGLGLGGMP